jgi:hypothetical protein
LGGIGVSRPAVVKVQVGATQHGPPAALGTAIVGTRAQQASSTQQRAAGAVGWEPVALLGALDARSVAVLGGPPTPPGVLGGR